MKRGHKIWRCKYNYILCPLTSYSILYSIYEKNIISYSMFKLCAHWHNLL